MLANRYGYLNKNKMKLKDFLEAQKVMYSFKSGFTNYPRWVEISFGIFGWMGISLIIFAIMKIIVNNVC